MSSKLPVEAKQYFTEQLRTAEDQIATWSAIADKLREMLGQGNSKPKDGQEAEDKEFSALSRPAAAEIILREAGKALHLKVIMERMAARGYKIEDQSQVYTSLYTTLDRQKKRFKRLGKGRFDLVNRDK